MTFEDLKFIEKPHGFGWVSRTSLNNGIEVSVVAGKYAYCNPREDLTDPTEYSLYEMAIFKDGEFTREYFDEDHGDDVLGFVDKETIVSIINKIQNG